MSNFLPVTEAQAAMSTAVRTVRFSPAHAQSLRSAVQPKTRLGARMTEHSSAVKRFARAAASQMLRKIKRKELGKPESLARARTFLAAGVIAPCRH